MGAAFQPPPLIDLPHGSTAYMGLMEASSSKRHRTIEAKTLMLLDEFLSAVESKHPDLLYLHDEELYVLVNTGTWKAALSTARVTVSRRR
jgi:hypothetical protein